MTDEVTTTMPVTAHRSPVAMTHDELERIRVGLKIVRGELETLIKHTNLAAFKECWAEDVERVDRVLGDMGASVEAADGSDDEMFEEWYDQRDRVLLRAAVDAFCRNERACLPGLRGIGRVTWADELADEAELIQNRLRPKFAEQTELELKA